MAKVKYKQERGDVIHPRTGDNAIPRIPGQRFLLAGGDGRQAFADWLTEKSNPFFAKAMVNRIWKAMMGRGLVEPTDDLRETNPATHPALLDELAGDFVEHGYDLRHTIRRIAASAAYARSAAVTPGNEADDRFYSHAIVRPLPPEVLVDAIADVTGVPNQLGDHPLGTRAVSLVDPKTPSTALDILGRCSREDTCEAPANAPSGGLTLQLHLLNGNLLNRKLADSKGRLSGMLAESMKPAQIVKAFYGLAFCRQPTNDELQYWNHALSQSDPVEQHQALEDFVWSVLSSREFIYNH